MSFCSPFMEGGMDDKIKILKNLFAIGTTAIATEHFFSASLSSPVSVKELRQSAEDVRDGYVVAVVLSLMIAFLFSVYLENYWSIITALVIIVIYVYLYERAIAGKELLPFI